MPPRHVTPRVAAAQLVADASHGENGFGEVEQVTNFEGVPVIASVCEDGFELIIVREVALEPMLKALGVVPTLLLV